ncbi:hypothetical protein RUM43_007641 [Polyplax serrata]|uniref:Uncharacterized protein n=1 Tax=Polyplax serrata TaxID=468196 RepID=A0AAN8PMK5_POLSC
MALNSSSEIFQGENRNKIDGLISPVTESEKGKMCYEDDDKESDKKKNSRSKEAKNDGKANESGKSEKPVTVEGSRESAGAMEDVPHDVVAEEKKNVDSSENPGKEPEATISLPSGPKHIYTQRQIDSFTVRVLAIEKTLENSENRVDQSKNAERENLLHSRKYLSSEVTRARSPSMPNTLLLGVPKEPGEVRAGSFDDSSSSGSKYGLGPLLEVKRPHCTLNCEHCKVILEERFRHKIIENVKNGQKPSFRPIVDDLYRDDPSSKDVVALMKKCWGEDPADRPDFSALKNHINKLNK